MATSTPFRFLELPGELRNRIYRYTLVTSDREDAIIVSSYGYARSAILLTCKQVHHEAFRIQQLENTFHFPILNFDATPAMKFIDKMQALKVSGILLKEDIIDCKITRGFTRSAFEDDSETPEPWRNLLVWLRYVHSGKDFVHPFANGNEQGVLLREMLDDMFQDAIDRRRMPWERVEQIFRYMRSGIVRADKTVYGSLMGFSAEGEDDQ